MSQKTTSKIKDAIVIIDDDLVIREVIKIFLAKTVPNIDASYEILTSSNGVEGLGLVIVSDPKIIILDTTLPKYSGRELHEYIKSNPGINRIDQKIIFLHNDDEIEGLSDRYIQINKKNKDFLRNLLITIYKNISSAPE